MPNPPRKPAPNQKRSVTPAAPVTRKPPQGSPQKPPALRNPAQPAPTARPSVKASEGIVSVKRQADELALKDKEIQLLRAKIVKYEKKMKDLKDLAAYISYTASKTNSVGPGIMSDWAKKIFDTINAR